MTDHAQTKLQNPGDYITLVFKGFCMGMADIIPGISGGTIAFLLGIYEDLIYSIKSFDWQFVRLLCVFKFKEAFAGVSWRFLGSVVIGIGMAIFTLSKIISWLLNNTPVLIYSFFFGLIVATVPVIARIIRKWTVGKVVAVCAAAVATYYIVGLVPLNTPDAGWFVFLSGAIAISAMILPGISGAFILVLLGKYQYLLDAVNQRDFIVLGAFVAGVAAGIVIFVRVLNWLFNKYHDLTVALLTGIVMGSLRKIWPWKTIVRSITTSHGKIIPIEEANILPAQVNGEVALAVFIMLVGFFLAMRLNSSSDRQLIKS